jgi:uncharacterized membrane protein YphA (DoxX/SURF4 family)
MLKIRHRDFLIIIIRLFLGYIFFSSGLCKLTHGQFGQLIGPPLLEDDLAKYGLALFARVIAVMQVVCGTLVLSQRFSTLGAIMLLPMNLSILAVTVSMGWNGTPYVNGFFLLLNLLLLVYDWKKLIVLVSLKSDITVNPTVADNSSNNIYNLFAIAFSLGALMSSRYSLISTNVFAVMTFGFVAYSIVHSKALSNLQTTIVLLIILDMLLITLRIKGINTMYLLGGNTILIFLLILLSLVNIQQLWKKRNGGEIAHNS